MLKGNKISQLLKQLDTALKLQPSTLTNGSSISSHADCNTNALAMQIYEIYFKDKVTCRNTIVAEDKVNHLRSMLQVRTNQAQQFEPTPEDVWIFGYGSLVWKADFPYIDRRRGYICNYQRRFYQHSIDHRGTHDKPGRVVTLLPTTNVEDRVYGVAYRIAAQQKEDVLQHLDYREKNGYERCTLEFHEFPESSSEHFKIIMYVATHENDSYAGKVWQISEIAQQIFTSAGPSGQNREYLFHLAHAMRELFPGANDEHLYELEREVLRLIDHVEVPTLEQALKKHISKIISEHMQEVDSSTDEIVAEIVALSETCKKPGWKEHFLTKEFLANDSS